MSAAHSIPAHSETATVPDDLFAAIAHHLPQPMLIANEHVEIQYVNPAWEEQFGYLLAEVRGQNPRILKSEKTPPEVHERMWRTLKAHKVFQTTDVIDKRKDGSLFNLRSTVFPVQSGHTLYYVQVLDDITDEKRATEFRTRYLQTAAHDIRTPLQILRILSDLAMIDSDTRNIQDMQAEIGRVDTMMTSLLDTKQFAAGRIIPQRTAFDISELVQTLVRGSHAHAGSVLCAGDAAVIVFADPRRIEQALTNLVENALKYGGSAEPVVVSVTDMGAHAVVSVHDKGRGIPIEEQPLLFNPNYRARQACESDVEGSGLGLYIVNEIVQAHGERLWVESVPGKGSVFSFTLPKL